MDILENFSPNKPYKFCLYLASVVLISTILTEPVGIDLNSLRRACIGLIATGLIAWTIDNVVIDKYNLLGQDKYTDMEKIIKEYSVVKLAINGVYLLIAFFIVDSSF